MNEKQKLILHNSLSQNVLMSQINRKYAYQIKCSKIVRAYYIQKRFQDFTMASGLQPKILDLYPPVSAFNILFRGGAPFTPSVFTTGMNRDSVHFNIGINVAHKFQ